MIEGISKELHHRKCSSLGNELSTFLTKGFNFFMIKSQFSYCKKNDFPSSLTNDLAHDYAKTSEGMKANFGTI